MDKAIRLFGPRGLRSEVVLAKSVRSREDARKLAPFVDESGARLVTWRSASFDSTLRRRKRRSCFAYYPASHTATVGITADPETIDFEEFARAKGESTKHQRVRLLLTSILRAMIERKETAPWSFIDKRVSEAFGLSGNLLEGVEAVETNYQIETPFGKSYSVDVALLGPKVLTKRLVLGAIEVEFTHRFDLIKCLLLKAMGFPLLSLDITEMGEAEITAEYVRQALLSTTADDEDGRRRNYVYLPEMLYPVFMQLPASITKEPKHQYLVFVPDGQLEKLRELLGKAKAALKLSDRNILVQLHNATNEQARVALENEGSIAGANWRNFNDHRYLRIVVERPTQRTGPGYLFHFILAKLVMGHFDALVGYKYRPAISNDEPDEPVWRPYLKIGEAVERVPLLPKQMVQPARLIFNELAMITK